MNKQVDVLYDEFVDSIAPEAILSKLKKSELIELLMYAHEDLQRLESYGKLEFENEILHDQVENQNGYINVDQVLQWIEVRTNDIIIELLPKLLEQYTREMNQAKQMQDKKMYA
jgi:hypothetical protein